MAIYIRSSACVSPQNTFGTEGFLDAPVEYHDTRLPIIAPDYTKYIDAKSARRMSHVIKMGVAAAKECLELGKIEMPGAIITGTALGCLEDTLTFMERMIDMDEQMLPPTAFIQSTHNTVAAQIALMLKCHNYNNTFVHKGISFESALIDAIMLLNEQEANDILVGGVEEMTDASYKVLGRLGLFKRWPLSNFELFNTPTNGTIGGEGASFFVLSDKRSEDNLAAFDAVETFYGPKDQAEIETKISTFLLRNKVALDEIDLVITGRNGDIKNDMIYAGLNNSIFKGHAIANYKHLCGEYAVSTSFALWLAANILKRQMVPESIIERATNNSPSPQKILIYNHYLNTYHSLILISVC
jgi:3-oxoacyl-(acyl-carrier-protein) synthase